MGLWLKKNKKQGKWNILGELIVIDFKSFIDLFEEKKLWIAKTKRWNNFTKSSLLEL